MREWKQIFSSCYNKINKDKYLDRETRLAALGAIEAAFLLGGAVSETEGAALLAKLSKDRTRAATEARRADPVQRIIEAAAQEYWDRKPDKREKPSDTARAICPKVKVRLSKLDGVPDSWQVVDSIDDALVIDQSESDFHTGKLGRTSIVQENSWKTVGCPSLQ